MAISFVNIFFPLIILFLAPCPGAVALGHSPTSHTVTTADGHHSDHQKASTHLRHERRKKKEENKDDSDRKAKEQGQSVKQVKKTVKKTVKKPKQASTPLRHDQTKKAPGDKDTKIKSNDAQEGRLDLSTTAHDLPEAFTRADIAELKRGSRLENPTSDDPYLLQEFECASEYDSPHYGCTDCRLNSTCSCDGLVKFGYAGRWTNWTESSGDIECNAASFGEDPAPEHGKVCMCRPKVYMCAVEWSKSWANCTECGKFRRRSCDCVGQARFGYAETWSAWTDVNGSFTCDTATFGDPYEGQGKVCQCQPQSLWADLAPTYSKTGSATNTAESPADNGIGGILKSIITVTLTYFFVYTALAITRTINQFRMPGPSAFEKVLETAAQSCVYFAPMLCALFFAVSKRADTLTGGYPGLYNMPPDWLQAAVGICAFSFFVQTLCYIIAEYSALQAVTTISDGNAVALVQTPQQLRTVSCWRVLCNIFTLIMYVMLAVVVLGVFFMEEPEEVRQEEGRTPVRAGTVITLTFAIAYFGVYLVLHMFRNQDIARGAQMPSFGFEVMKLAATAMNFAPMLSILFLGTQLAGDWAGVFVEKTASRWMYVCLGSVLLQVFLVIVAPFLASAELQTVGQQGEVDFITKRGWPADVFVCVSIVRWVAMLVLYIGVLVVINSLWSTGEAPTMTHQLYRFSFLYFAAYLVLWVAITMRQLTEGSYMRAIRILNIAKNTVVFCPMLSALYLSSFVRAHSITNDYGRPGVPQAYVQDNMVLSTLALTVMLLMVMFAGFSTTQVGLDGHEKPAGSPMGYLIIYNIAMVVLFISVATVIYGLFTIDQSNANSDGAWFA